jgi:hypothetical protein
MSLAGRAIGFFFAPNTARSRLELSSASAAARPGITDLE